MKRFFHVLKIIILLIYCLHFITIHIADGSVAHLGERLHGMEEVEGSIPFRSTKNTRYQLAGKNIVRYSYGCKSNALKDDKSILNKYKPPLVTYTKTVKS